jgi:lipopolysaccharide export system permease protein
MRGAREARVTTLDAYVLRRTIIPLAFVFAAFVGIFVLVDLFDHAHSFIDNEVPVRVVVAYYAHYMPYVVVLTAPVAMLLATLLAVGRFTRSNELTAMKGAGVSLYRILVPILLLAASLSAASLVIAETVVPFATRHRLDIEDTHIRKRPSRTVRSDVIYMRPDGTTLLAKRFDTRSNTLEEVTVQDFTEDLKPRTRIDAATGTWENGRWVLHDGRTRRFTAGAESTSVFDSLPLPYADPSPRELSTRLLKPEELGYWDLRAHITRLRSSGTDPGDLPVQLELKLSFPFVVLIMTLLGAPIAAGARRGGFALAFAAALAISFVYYGVLQVGSVLGRQGLLPPALSAWVANVLFAGIGVWIMAKTPK